MKMKIEYIKMKANSKYYNIISNILIANKYTTITLFLTKSNQIGPKDLKYSTQVSWTIFMILLWWVF